MIEDKFYTGTIASSDGKTMFAIFNEADPSHVWQQYDRASLDRYFEELVSGRMKWGYRLFHQINGRKTTRDQISDEQRFLDLVAALKAKAQEEEWCPEFQRWAERIGIAEYLEDPIPPEPRGIAAVVRFRHKVPAVKLYHDGAYRWQYVTRRERWYTWEELVKHVRGSGGTTEGMKILEEAD